MRIQQQLGRPILLPIFATVPSVIVRLDFWRVFLKQQVSSPGEIKPLVVARAWRRARRNQRIARFGSFSGEHFSCGSTAADNESPRRTKKKHSYSPGRDFKSRAFFRGWFSPADQRGIRALRQRGSWPSDQSLIDTLGRTCHGQIVQEKKKKKKAGLPLPGLKCR